MPRSTPSNRDQTAVVRYLEQAHGVSLGDAAAEQNQRATETE